MYSQGGRAQVEQLEDTGDEPNTKRQMKQGQLQLLAGVKPIGQGNITTAKFHKLTDKLHQTLMTVCFTDGTDLATEVLVERAKEYIRGGRTAIAFGIWVNGMTTIYNAIAASEKNVQETSFKKLECSLNMLENELNKHDFTGKETVQGDLCKMKYMQIDKHQLAKLEKCSRKGHQTVSHCEISSWTSGIYQPYLMYRWENIRQSSHPDVVFEEIATEAEKYCEYFVVAREHSTFAQYESVMALQFSLQARLKLPCRINGNTLKLYLTDYKLSAKQIRDVKHLLSQAKLKYMEHLDTAGIHQYKVMKYLLAFLEAILQVRAAQQQTVARRYLLAYDLLQMSCEMVANIPQGRLVDPSFAPDSVEVLIHYCQSLQDQLPEVKLVEKYNLDQQELHQTDIRSLTTESSDGFNSISSQNESVESEAQD